MIKDNWLGRLTTLRDSGRVARAHTVPHLKEYLVGQHVYGSQLIAIELCRLNGEDDAGVGAVLVALLLHDAPELDTGDVPAPTKRALAKAGALTALEGMDADFYESLFITMPKLTKRQADIVKASDTIDLMWWCCDERALGNRTERLAVVYKNVCDYIQEQMRLKGVDEIDTLLFNMWRSM